jgi:copper chaperone NosL
MRRLTALLLALVLSACGEEEQATPSAHKLDPGATGYYCGMLLGEHAGPKGQILLKSRKEPIWFSSARDTFTFLQLPEEPKDVAATYVSDMAKAASWDSPGAENWVAAEGALYVVGSDREGGMGGPEAVPFSDEAAAQKFIQEHGGRIVKFEEAKKEVADPAKSPDGAGGG